MVAEHRLQMRGSSRPAQTTIRRMQKPLLSPSTACTRQCERAVGRLLDCRDLRVVVEFDAVPLARVSEAARELVDVAGRIGRREKAAVKIALQRRLDARAFRSPSPVAIESAFAQQRIHLAAASNSFRVL